MDYSTKKKNSATVQITVKSNAQEVEEAYQIAYEKAKQHVKLPGFRKGKVPVELIEKHLGESIASEAARELIAGTFQKIAEKLDPPPISIPQFEVESFQRGKGATFTGVYDTYPEVKIGKYKKIKGTLDRVIVSDSTVQKELDRLQKENAVSQSRDNEAVQHGDIATMSIDIRDEKKSLFKNKEFQFKPGENRHLPGLDEHIIGMKVGEPKSFELQIADDFVDPKYAGKKLNISAELSSAVYPVYPEINDDFAKELGEFETLDHLKQKIREEMSKSADEELKARCLHEIITEIVQDTKMDVPQSMLDSELERRLEQIRQRFGNKDLKLADIAKMSGNDPVKLEEDLKSASMKAVQERLVLQEIIKREKIEVLDSEIEEEFRNRFSRVLDEENIKKLLEKGEIREDIEGRVLYRKCVDWIFEHADIKNGKEIPFEQLRHDHDHEGHDHDHDHEGHDHNHG